MFVCACAHVCLHTHVCACVQACIHALRMYLKSPEEGIGSPGARVTMGIEVPCVGAETVLPFCLSLLTDGDYSCEPLCLVSS